MKYLILMISLNVMADCQDYFEACMKYADKSENVNKRESLCFTNRRLCESRDKVLERIYGEYERSNK